MTRKRFIKLLMGRYGYDRNAARQDAQLRQDYTHQRDLTNRAAKAWGYSIRLPLITVEPEETVDIQGFKEGLAMEYEKYFQTPVQCIAVDTIE